VILGLIIVITWYSLTRLSGLMSPVLMRTAVARWDVVAQKWTGSAFVVRKEIVVRAPAGGTVRLLVPEGARVRAGAGVCQVGNEAVRAPASGLISFSLDGLEQAVSADSSFLHDVAVPRQQSAWRSLSDGDHVDSDTPLFRLVDDLSWYLYVAVRGPQPLQQGRSVVVRFATGEVKMRVDRVERREDKTMALLTGDHLPIECLNVRSFDVQLQAEGREGVVIPVPCLVEDDGRHGVYVLVGRRPLYRRVEVLASDDDSALVTGVPLGARVVTNPRVVKR
jgi:putative membrane fusion protein